MNGFIKEVRLVLATEDDENLDSPSYRGRDAPNDGKYKQKHWCENEYIILTGQV